MKGVRAFFASPFTLGSLLAILYMGLVWFQHQRVVALREICTFWAVVVAALWLVYRLFRPLSPRFVFYNKLNVIQSLLGTTDRDSFLSEPVGWVMRFLVGALIATAIAVAADGLTARRSGSATSPATDGSDPDTLRPSS